VQVADSCCVDAMKENFAWKRGFQNCWTGYPNDGKTQFTLMMMTVKALRDGWKFVVWSPEMKSATFIENEIAVHYNDLINDIIWMASGVTPYQHIAKKYVCDLLPMSDYLEWVKWVQEHFIFLDPKNKKPDDIYQLLTNTFEDQGYDVVLIDPFKNIEQDIRLRDDIYLEQLFAKFKDFAVRTNTVMNWIAHPKANINRIRKVNGEDLLMPCDQYMLNGGAAWNNSMDGIYSIFRPDLLTEIRSPNVNFINLKQRKQELVAHRGKVENIEFNFKNRRYIFNGNDPLD